MSYLDEIATAVAGASTGFVLDTSVFVDSMPDTPNTCIGVYGPAGSGPFIALGTTTPSFESPGLQVICRSTSYTTARSNAETVYLHLITKVNTSLGSTGGSSATYLSIDPLQTPFTLGSDENDRPLFGCNYRVRKGLSA